MKGLNFITSIIFLLTLSACKKDPPAPLPLADFFVENSGCTASCKLYFYDQSDNAVKWNWKFGNGVTSNNANDSTTYHISGTYEVWLYVWNKDDVIDSVRKNITIH